MADMLTKGIRDMDRAFYRETGHGFYASETGVTVLDRQGDLEETIPLADIDPEWSIEEVAHWWLDEHRPGWDR
jgi:hypothetical protein